MKLPGRVPLSPALLVTVTFSVAAACEGVVAVIVVLFTTTVLVAVDWPKLAVAPVAKLVPVIVRIVPPLTGPVLGLTAVTVAPGPGVVGVVDVNDQIGPPAMMFAMVFPTIRQ